MEAVAVTDLETELREAMRAAVADARPPRDLFHLLRHRRRRNRTRQLAISAATAAIVVAAVPASLELLSSGGRPASGAGSATISAPASGRSGPAARHPEQPRPPRGWAADGALFQVIEYDSTSSPYEFPPRRAPLGLGPLGGPYECWGVKTHLLLFGDGDGTSRSRPSSEPKRPPPSALR